LYYEHSRSAEIDQSGKGITEELIERFSEESPRWSYRVVQASRKRKWLLLLIIPIAQSVVVVMLWY
jgi:hypothetical protein